MGGGISAYPVGSYYFTSDARNPSEILGGGTWEKLEAGRFLMASGGSYPIGSKGGEATHVLTEDEMPEHSHDGSASLSGSVSSSLNHKHDKGDMRIVGETSLGYENSLSFGVSGAFYNKSISSTKVWPAGSGSQKYALSFDSDRSGAFSGNTGSAGSHNHSLTGVTATLSTETAGEGKAHNNLPPYIAVNIWRRTA